VISSLCPPFFQGHQDYCLSICLWATTMSGFNSGCRTFISLCNQPATQGKANSAFHPSGVGKWVPDSAGKAKAGMVHSVSGWTRCLQVKVWDPLRTRAIPERLEVSSRQGAIQIHIYLTLTIRPPVRLWLKNVQIQNLYTGWFSCVGGHVVLRSKVKGPTVQVTMPRKTHTRNAPSNVDVMWSHEVTHGKRLHY